MSNKHIENLTFRLLQALDKNYDVVNMDAVLCVITALENTNITKEQLETTRLAKYINLFRRRTTSEQLAKRAKSLLKRWREMVGMQQQQRNPLGNDSIRNEGATTSSNFQENINLIDGMPALQSNTTIVPFLANNNNNNRNNTYSSSSYDSSGKLPATGAPTSFSNVLGGFSTTTADRNNLPSFQNSNISNGPNASRRKPLHFSETFSHSHLNSLGGGGGGVGSSIQNDIPNKRNSSIQEPIIIDIEDSNSGSNLVEQLLEKDEDDDDDDDDDDDVVLINNSSADKSNKLKKLKKEKKRTRDHRTSLFQEDFSTPLVVIDPESSLSQQPNLHKQATTTTTTLNLQLPSTIDGKIRSENMKITNISEILSLSNSSMSSMFPTSSVGATKNLFSQSNRPLSESELSFAGKFAQQSCLTSASTSSASAIVSNENNKNNNNNNSSSFIFNNDEYAGTKATTKPVADSTTNVFQPFVGGTTTLVGGCHLNNDSASESHSAFAIIDCNSQGNKSKVKQITDSSDRSQFAGGSKRFQQLSPIITETIQQSTKINLNASCAMPPSVPPSEQRVPKKRGRKKGSKGIDSLMAKDTSLSSQMLMQSLGSGSKKVKTTKELYAEMQNRKMGVSTPTTPSHWGGGVGGGGQQSQTFVRRDSFCSEPSLHSFDACSTNATVSTIATSSTPEKVSLQRPAVDVDSGSDSIISGGGVTTATASAAILPSEKVGSCPKKPSTKVMKELTKKQNASSKTTLTSIEIQLRELVENLPAAPSKDTIERECEIDTVPCSCKIFESIPQQPSDLEAEIDGIQNAKCGNLLSLNALKEASKDDDCDQQQPFITISIDKIDESSSHPSQSSIVKQQTSSSSSSSNVHIINNKKTQPDKPKKSIFDLDFDDDEEDPLQTLIAEVAAASCSSNPSQMKSELSDNAVEEGDAEEEVEEGEGEESLSSHVKTFNDQKLPSDETLIDDIVPVIGPVPVPLPAFPTYKIEEDPACLAKERFELQVQKITGFHIKALHNFFIPNVNGNWNEKILPKKEFINSNGMFIRTQTEELLADGSNVVPKYSSAENGICEYIRKDLRDIEFDREFKPKARPNTIEELFYETPFLGVSRCLKSFKSSHRKTRKHRQQQQSKDDAEIKEDQHQSKHQSPDNHQHQTIGGEAEGEGEGKGEGEGEGKGEGGGKGECEGKGEGKGEGEGEGVGKQVDEKDFSENSITNVGNIQNTINKSPLKLMLDDITINVDDDETIAPLTTTTTTTIGLSKSESVETKPPHLLAIASNVNFNNNQIGDSLVIDGGEIEANTNRAKKSSCTKENTFEGEETTAKMKICTQAHRNRITCDMDVNDDGDVKNNNCNDKEGKNEGDGEEEASSCESHSSLKQTQMSINLKLRKLQEQNSSKSSSFHSKRKRRRKSREKRQKLKCIKIAINGGITTQRHIKMGSTTTSEDDDNDDNDDNDDDESVTSKTDLQDVVLGCVMSSAKEKDFEYESRYDDGEGGIPVGSMSWQQDGEISEQESFNNPEDCDDNDDHYEDADNDDLEEDDDDDEDDDDEYCGDFHEVVTRDISPSSELGNNHIVLTIKKTPSKINSPCSSSLPPVSPLPAVVSATINQTHKNQEEKTMEIMEQQQEEEQEQQQQTTAIMEDATNEKEIKDNHWYTVNNNIPNVLQKYRLNRPIFRNHRRLIKRHKIPKCQPFRFPDESPPRSANLGKKSKHQQLFFSHEMFVDTTTTICGKRRPIFDMSSCSSSCAESSEYEYESLSDKEDDSDKVIIKIVDPKTITNNTNVFSASENYDDDDDDDSSSTQSESDRTNVKSEVVEDEKHIRNLHLNNNELPDENNGLLESFNNIDALENSSAAVVAANSIGKTNNCDEFYSKDFSKNNLINEKNEIKNDGKNGTSSTHLEYISGLRPVNGDNDNDDIGIAEDVNKCNGFQEFREWNQLLQRRSYNNECLTVLPYVVLD